MKKLLAVIFAISGSTLAYTNSATHLGISAICPLPNCGYMWQDNRKPVDEAADPRKSTYLWSD